MVNFDVMLTLKTPQRATYCQPRSLPHLNSTHTRCGPDLGQHYVAVLEVNYKTFLELYLLCTIQKYIFLVRFRITLIVCESSIRWQYCTSPAHWPVSPAVGCGEWPERAAFPVSLHWAGLRAGNPVPALSTCTEGSEQKTYCQSYWDITIKHGIEFKLGDILDIQSEQPKKKKTRLPEV